MPKSNAKKKAEAKLRASQLNNEDKNEKEVLSTPVVDYSNTFKGPYAYADSFLDGPFPKDSFITIRPDESDFVSDIMRVNDVLKNRVTNAAATPKRRKPQVLKTLLRSQMLKDDKKLDLEKVMVILNGMEEVEVIRNKNPKLVGRVDTDAGIDYSKLYIFFKYNLPETYKCNCLTHVPEKRKEPCFNLAIREDGRLYLVYCHLSELAAQILIVKVASFLHNHGIPFIELCDLRIQVISRLARGHVGYIPNFENKEMSNVFMGRYFNGLLKEVIVTKDKEKILLVTPNDRTLMYMFYVLKADGTFFIGGIRPVTAIEEMFRTFYNIILYDLNPKYQNADRVPLDSGIDKGKEKDVEKKSATPGKKINKEKDVQKKSETPENKINKEKDVKKKPTTSTLSQTTPHTKMDKEKEKVVEKKSATPEKKIIKEKDVKKKPTTSTLSQTTPHTKMDKEKDVEKKLATPEKKIIKEKDVKKKPTTSTLSQTTPHTKMDKEKEKDVEKKLATPEKKIVKEKDVKKKPTTSTLTQTSPDTKKDKEKDVKKPTTSISTLTPTSPDKDKEEKKETPAAEKVKVRRPRPRKDN